MQALWPDYQQREVAALAARAAERGMPDPQGFAERVAGIYHKWHHDYLPRIKADPAEMTRLLAETVFRDADLQCAD
ncbi:hypothetical protein GCM10011505_17410 [Tistrella bauzanensis]|uniref:Uncharacterized protein n=2 Tax=Tistrella bauzanensis TaxID=657419 RepID=A0ABQ1IDS0_9PROT|nr:hypothetical protein GCM10011505_17410 [Tistrella bauzanensis]